MRRWSLLLAFTMVACNPAEEDSDTGRPPRDTAADDSGGDSGTEETPVWSAWPVGSSSTLQGVYASGAGVYVVGTGGQAWVGGADQSWIEMSPDVDENDLTDLWGQGAGETLNLWATAGGGYVAQYSVSGWDVEDIGTSNHEGLGGDDPASLYAVSWGGVYHFDGATWVYESTPNGERLNDVYASGQVAFAVGEEGAILHRTAEGTWAAMESGVTVNLNGVAAVSNSDVWAVGEEGTALHYDGTSWTVVPTGVTTTLWAVFAPSSAAVVMVGNNGTALRWNGAAIESLPTGVDNNLYAIHGVSGSNMWAVGNRGTTLQYKE